MRGDMKKRKKRDESKNRISRQGNFFSGLIHLYKWVHPGPINALHDTPSPGDWPRCQKGLQGITTP